MQEAMWKRASTDGRRQYEWICVRDSGRCRGKHVQFDADEWRELDASVRSARWGYSVCGACSHACARPPFLPPLPPGCCCCSSILRGWADEWGELAGRLFNIAGGASVARDGKDDILHMQLQRLSESGSEGEPDRCWTAGSCPRRKMYDVDVFSEKHRSDTPSHTSAVGLHSSIANYTHASLIITMLYISYINCLWSKRQQVIDKRNASMRSVWY